MEQRAELVAFPANECDDFDPDALTSLLGIVPTSVQRKGEVLRSRRIRPYSAWMWETAGRVEPDTELLIHEVLAAFEPVAAQLDEARNTLGLEFQVGVVISMYGSIQVEPDGTTGAVVSAPALYLSLGTLRRLTNLGCALYIDTYVLASE